jgi:phosphate uptake regulator
LQGADRNRIFTQINSPMATLSEKVLELSPADQAQVEQLVDALLEQEKSAAERTRNALEHIDQHPVQGQGLLDRISDPVAWQRSVRRDRTLPRR